MPSRNNREKFSDAASRSPNDTGCSLSITRSDMFCASPQQKHAPVRRPSPAATAESLQDGLRNPAPSYPPPLAGRAGGVETKKRSRQLWRLQVITGRRQTEWIGATQCPQIGPAMNGTKSLNGV